MFVLMFTREKIRPKCETIWFQGHGSDNTEKMKNRFFEKQMKFSRQLDFVDWTYRRGVGNLIICHLVGYARKQFSRAFSRLPWTSFFRFFVNLFLMENFPIAWKLSTRHRKPRCKLIILRNGQLITLNTTNYGTLKAITHGLTYKNADKNSAIESLAWWIELRVVNQRGE